MKTYQEFLIWAATVTNFRYEKGCCGWADAEYAMTETAAWMYNKTVYDVYHDIKAEIESRFGNPLK